MDCEICKECGKNTDNCRCGGEEQCVTCPLLHKGGAEPKCTCTKVKEVILRGEKMQ